MITGRNLHDAYLSVLPHTYGSHGTSWEMLGETGHRHYREMAISLLTRLGICPACGSIPAEGLQDVDGHLRCGHDCPRVDSGRYCDHRSVGALIRNERGHILLFARNTYPYCVAGPAGHCDGDEEDYAIRASVGQETGLLVLSAETMAQFWHNSRCRRRYAGSHGHMWTFYDVHATGHIHGSEREVQCETLRWYSPQEVAELVERTSRKMTGEEPTGDTLDLPWYQFFVDEMGYKA